MGSKQRNLQVLASLRIPVDLVVLLRWVNTLTQCVTFCNSDSSAAILVAGNLLSGTRQFINCSWLRQMSWANNETGCVQHTVTTRWALFQHTIPNEMGWIPAHCNKEMGYIPAHCNNKMGCIPAHCNKMGCIPAHYTKRDGLYSSTLYQTRWVVFQHNVTTRWAIF